MVSILELALQLQPKTREIVCVSGTGTEEQRWNIEAGKVLERFATRVRTRWLDKLPFTRVRLDARHPTRASIPTRRNTDTPLRRYVSPLSHDFQQRVATPQRKSLEE